MFEGLDDIDWASLKHAYGSAADVPAMLRRLASSDPAERDEALHAAYGNIFHQGTRYEATPKAIPFLIAIAERGNAAILDLLTHCVAGYFSTVRGPRNGSGPIFGEATRPMEDYGETSAILKACEEAAAPAVPVCIRLLAGNDTNVRCHALKLIGALHPYAERYEMIPRLQDIITSDREVAVRAMGAFALTHVLPRPQANVLVTIARAHSDELVRLVATMGCMRRYIATPEMSPDLLRWFDDSDLAADYAELPCGTDALSGDLGALLGTLDPTVLAPMLPSLVDTLRVADDFSVCGVLSAALRAVFGEGGAPGDALTRDQRTVLETLVRNQAFWSIGNAMEILDEYKVPAMPERLAELVGIPYERDAVENARIGARAMANFGPQRASKEWQKVLDNHPDDAEALCQIGILYSELGNERASVYLEKGLANPTGVKSDVVGRAWFALALARHNDNENEPALEAFSKAQQFLRGGAREHARENRIVVLQSMGRNVEALAIVEEKPARTLDDFYHLGLAQVKAAKYPESIASISRVLADDPDHALAHYTIACAHALSGNKGEALASVGRAIECDPDLAPDIAADADLASLADDPRFQDLVGAHD
jgi:tetratricopeptide (TPR) repeat protein